MTASLLYWCEVYKKLKYEALCLDVETEGFNKPISVVGLYQPKDGLVEHTFFVRGKDLTLENLKQAFKSCKLLITYNGLSLDIPKIKQEFPGAIPENIPVLDLYLFARKLGLDTNLKVLETTLNIDRLFEHTKRRFIAAKLWRKYSLGKNQQALLTLIEYNKQDTINLYPIAEQLVAMALKK
jgi:uncharacterized protein YprB with RNaseH-like and TPR domain